ncbi:hypothetical protein MishRS11D_34530 [Methylomagnum ishizawai]|nr:hypothetical protein MishRS11D_34530 [Methylomagnum ishizawai]
MKMNKLAVGLSTLAGVAVWLSGPALADGAEGGASKPSRQALFNKDVDLPSARIQTHVVRVTFPAGAKSPTHTHPGPGPRYVIKGKLKVVDGGETKIYSAGDVFWESGHEMTVENVAGDESQMIFFEMAPRD